LEIIKSFEPTSTFQQSVPTASQSINFNIEQKIFKDKGAESSTRKILPTVKRNKYQCNLCNRRYKNFDGGIIKHLREIHNVSEEDKIEENVVQLV